MTDIRLMSRADLDLVNARARLWRNRDHDQSVSEVTTSVEPDTSGQLDLFPPEAKPTP